MTGEVPPPPGWQGPINSFLRVVESGATAPEFHIDGANNLIRELLVKSDLSDIGTLQDYLESQRAGLQLVAVPMGSELIPEGLVSVDPRDGTEQPYGLMVIVHKDLEIVDALFTQSVTDPEANKALLRDHTGLVVPSATVAQGAESHDEPPTLQQAVLELERNLAELMRNNVPPAVVLQKAGVAVIAMVRSGLAADLGEIQELQRKRGYPLFELTTVPIANLGVAGAVARDILTNEPRDHYFVVCISVAELEPEHKKYQAIIQNHAANVARLRSETGVATVGDV